VQSLCDYHAAPPATVIHKDMMPAHACHTISDYLRGDCGVEALRQWQYAESLREIAQFRPWEQTGYPERVASGGLPDVLVAETSPWPRTSESARRPDAGLGLLPSRIRDLAARPTLSRVGPLAAAVFR
jgi:hypothetical protein